MKRLALLLAVCFAAVLLHRATSAQPTSPRLVTIFDHMALHVHDLGKSAQFYESVVGLTKITDPFNDDRHVWFSLGPHLQLHLIGGGPQTGEHDIDVHLAFRVESLEEFVDHLNRAKIKYWSTKREPGVITVRPDGVKQVYFQDPDGYWIEVNNARP